MGVDGVDVVRLSVCEVMCCVLLHPPLI
uniref:Uncharacterized protein n=1 Tax=Arundo donax TaxID=35708 RepID=A0A0A8YF53_ARUDO